MGAGPVVLRRPRILGVTAPNECLDALRQRLSDGVDVFGDVVSGRPRFCADLTRAIYFDIR
ncbi:hypothetical protein DW352_25335 [Pseudolabrys taiwanensis]|uniref:Uncharacterized protein n=1 Tax=Pseudolabrys taiwanensis TaxID=331696 RepID=A0A346A308_9HYPH|nr:hypothetical protein DW352_25335 [Pseudolabrys taiwanensis]